MTARCPACPHTRAVGQYLCRGCWRRLPGPARGRLTRRDGHAARRLQQLLDQIRVGVPLADVQITE